MTFSGTLKIRVVEDQILKGGASFTISPNPLTGTGNISISDGGDNYDYYEGGKGSNPIINCEKIEHDDDKHDD